MRKIGDLVWIKDENHRVYRKEDGISGSPIFREFFIKCTIVAENAKSWILNNGFKIDKNTEWLRCPNRGNNWYALSQRVYWSQADVDDAIYVHDHSVQIARAVQSCENANVLKTIDRMLKVTGLVV